MIYTRLALLPPTSLQSAYTVLSPQAPVNPLHPNLLHSHRVIAPPSYDLWLAALARPFRAGRRDLHVECPVEERSVHNSAGADDGDTDFDKRPNSGIGVGPRCVEEGETV